MKKSNLLILKHKGMCARLVFVVMVGFVLSLFSCNSNPVEGISNEDSTIDTYSESPGEEQPTTPSEEPTTVEVDVIEVENLYGVWQLMTVTHTGDRPDDYLLTDNPGRYAIDCSQFNILYEFKPNGILTVSDFDRPESIQVAGVLAGVHEAGDYPYSVGEFHDGRNLQIGSDYEVWWCRIDGNELEFDTAPLDGPVFKLIRLEN